LSHKPLIRYAVQGRRKRCLKQALKQGKTHAALM
jgi:hypothetical protein